MGKNSLRAAANREVWARLTPDEYEKRCSAIRLGVRNYFNELSDEELCAVLQSKREDAAWWARLTPEEQIAVLQPMREGQREGHAAWWARLTPEEQIAVLQPMREGQREGHAAWWARLTPEEKAAWRVSISTSISRFGESVMMTPSPINCGTDPSWMPRGATWTGA